MNSLRVATRGAVPAAFLLFAAGLLGVGPAEASRTTTDARPDLSSASSEALASPSLELSLLEPIDSAESSPRFGFGEDLGLLDPEAGPGGFVVFARETSRCELTYARNNPLRYVDPDGRDAKDFIIGLGNGIRSNLFPGSQRLSYVDPDFNRGQRLGDAISLVAGVYGIFGGAALQGGGASFSFATGGSSAAAVPVGALVSGYSVTVAGSAAANLMAASQFDGGSSERNPAQDKRLSAGEAKFLKEKGFDPEQLKADIVGKNVSKYDIFKDRAGNLYVKPKSGEGFGERLNMNIVELRGNV